MADLDTPGAGGLNARQQRFALEYLKDCNGKQAAIRAGYSAATAESQASRLLRHGKVRAFLGRRTVKAAERAELSASYVLTSLREVADRCRQAVPVMVRGEKRGEMVQKTDLETGEGVWGFDSAGANRALELLGKHLALFTEKVEASGPNGGPLEFVIRDLAKES